MTEWLLPIWDSLWSAFSWVGLGSFLFTIFPRRVKLSVCSFWLFNYKYNPQSITNIVSWKVYGGDQVPSQIRQEIIDRTHPRMFFFKKIENNDKTDGKDSQ